MRQVLNPHCSVCLCFILYINMFHHIITWQNDAFFFFLKVERLKIQYVALYRVRQGLRKAELCPLTSKRSTLGRGDGLDLLFECPHFFFLQSIM